MLTCCVASPSSSLSPLRVRKLSTSLDLSRHSPLDAPLDRSDSRVCGLCIACVPLLQPCSPAGGGAITRTDANCTRGRGMAGWRDEMAHRQHAPRALTRTTPQRHRRHRAQSRCTSREGGEPRDGATQSRDPVRNPEGARATGCAATAELAARTGAPAVVLRTSPPVSPMV